MKDITIIFLMVFIIFTAVFSFIRSKRKAGDELKGLTVLMYMFLAQKEGDANSVLFALEKYSELNRNLINQLRINYLKNTPSEPEGLKRKHYGTSFYEAAEILFRSGPARAAEFMEGAEEIMRNNRSRVGKVRSEIVNSIGIIFTMVIMFLIIIYFLSPYTSFFNIYTM